MKVVFPHGIVGGNPYKRALANALRSQGVEVILGTTYRILPILRTIWRYRRPEILHLQGTQPFLLGRTRFRTLLKSSAFVAELLLIKLLGVKIIFTVHDLYNHERRFMSLELAFNRIVVRLSDQIIVHSASAKQAVEKAYIVKKGAKIKIIPHGKYIDYYDNKIIRSEARKRLQVAKDLFIFLSLGLLRQYKGIPELIDAFSRLNAPQARLLIVGRAYPGVADEIRTKAQLNPNVRLVLEFIPDEEVQLYMNACDVVVVPYRDILTSGALILAMSFGKPVIAPAIGYMLDVLDSDGGFLYEPSQTDGLVSALEKALSADLPKIGAHNLQLAQRLSWDIIGRSTYEVYRRAL